MTFDTLDTDSVATAGMTFSNGNLTAQGGSGMTLLSSGIAQAVEGKKSGKWFVEFTCNTSGSTDGVGILNSWGVQVNAAVGGFIGGNGGSAPSNDMGWGYYTNNHIANKNVTQTSVHNTTWTTGDVIGMAIDLDNKRIWWNKNGSTSWVGTSGTPDPASNTNGFDISHLLSNNCRVYPAANFSSASTKFTANFGATSFSTSVPSGFTAGWTNTTAGTYFGTFAATGHSSNAFAITTNNKNVSKYTATKNGHVGIVVMPLCNATFTDLKHVIYDATGTGGLPGALLGVSSAIASGVYGENSFDFTTQNIAITNGSSYYFGITSDTTNINILCPPLTSGIVFNAANTYASPSNPFGASPSTANFRYPIIINYAPATPRCFGLVI